MSLCKVTNKFEICNAELREYLQCKLLIHKYLYDFSVVENI